MNGEENTRIVVETKKLRQILAAKDMERVKKIVENLLGLDRPRHEIMD